VVDVVPDDQVVPGFDDTFRPPVVDVREAARLGHRDARRFGRLGETQAVVDGP